MADNLYSRISFLRDSLFMHAYERHLENIKLKVDPLLWMIVSVFFSAIAASATFLVLLLLNAMGAMIMIFVVFVVVLDVLVGYPYIKGMQRITEIESDLPDALKQMADILKAGGTYEYALREIAQSDFGPLTKEIANVLRKLEEGENFEASLLSLSHSVDSRLVKRSVTIIVDSVRAGAGLADILEEIAEDIRQTNRINHERKARTLMQVLFMVAAGAFVTPFIFGLISMLADFMAQSTMGLISGADSALKARILSEKNWLIFMIQIYVFIEITATSVMLSLMREGNKNKSIIYLPALLFIAYIVYFVSVFLTGQMFQGTGSGGGLL